MLKSIVLDKNSPKHIYLQIADLITMQIEKGILKGGGQLPSINMFSEKYLVARDTVERGYRELRKRGYINSVIGKGFFVNVTINKKVKVLLIVNKISNFKKIIYYSILNNLEEFASVDLEIHHYKPLVLNDILDRNLRIYNKQPLPSNRKAFSIWYYNRKNSPLQPAGLVGPVEIKEINTLVL